MDWLITGLLVLGVIAFAYLYYTAWLDNRDYFRYLDSLDPKKNPKKK